MKQANFTRFFFTLLLSVLSISSVHAEVMLQWFETEWDEMYRRIPEVAEAGYAYIWCPPPTKAPTGKGTKWGNVGYSLYDRFDLGDVPQRGSLETRYGSRGSLRNMVNQMHQCDVKIIPDIVMNHNGNGPDFREYPGTRPTDFHVWWQANYCNGLNYKRAPRMSNWNAEDGYGGTMYEDLCSLIDLRTEDNVLTRKNGTYDRFTTPNGPSFVTGESFTRHIGQYDLYPYYDDINHTGYVDEEISDMLYRWISWLGNAIDYDGLRLDAGKHTPWEFFGTDSDGFLHEAQWNTGIRHNIPEDERNDTSQVFQNYIKRDHSLIFAEILSPWNDLAYWANNNPMRFLDYGIKKTADGALSGNIGNFVSADGIGNNFPETQGIMYVWGHDEGPAENVDLGYAWTLTHIGFPMVYFTGSNIEWQDKWDNRTWMIPGYDGFALGDDGNKIKNLVWIHNNFAWGREHNRWHDGDFLAMERYDDLNGNNSPDTGEGILLVALNDSGSDNSHELQTAFADGTVLKDYTGSAGDITIYGGGKAYVTVPGNSGQGWVCYAPYTPEVSFTVSATEDMNWIVPGGEHSADKPRTIPRITQQDFTVNATLSGTDAEKVALKWGQGETAVGSGTHYTGDQLLITANYEEMSGSGTDWSLTVTDAQTKIPEGLNTVKVRAYSSWPDGSEPARFNTATKVVYVDLEGPAVDISFPTEHGTVYGSGVMVISNADFTAYGMTVALDGAAGNSADEVMKGLWKYNLAGLEPGTHTAVVTTTEADWGDPRTVINTSVCTRIFNVASNRVAIALNHAENDQLEVPFFKTVISTEGTPDELNLYWDGYKLPFNGGGYTDIFNGEVVFTDFHPWTVTNHLWGNFVNGPHFFEAERVDAGVKSRTSCRVVFNLYGQQVIDSDGDGIPDNVEIPYFDQQAIPDEKIPGDDNQNCIPEWWESWGRLNPYNHSTFYNGQWDDQNDFDQDGFSNYDEVYAGYLTATNVYLYDIYDAESHPDGTPAEQAEVTATPEPAQRTEGLTITYRPQEGPLQHADAITLLIGHSKRTAGEWLDTESIVMDWVPASTNWSATYSVPTNATSVDFVFTDGDERWDNNNQADWQVSVQGNTPEGFAMDGGFDSEGYRIIDYNMHLYAALKGSSLYLATWGTGNGGNDHFLYAAPELGDATDPAPGWNKAGVAFFDTGSKPFITAEGNGNFYVWNNASGIIANAGKSGGTNALEGVIDLIDTFGYIPEAIYVAAVAYGSEDGGGINSQSPHAWGDADDSLNVTEFQRVPLNSIRDDDGDGTFDAGSPLMWTVTGGSTNTANYGLCRFFLNELAEDSEEITVILQPNVGTNRLSDVELFSNLNRRDFVVMPGEEDPDSVTPTSESTYYRAYPMTDNGDGVYSITLPVTKCGAYRINARYRVNDGPYCYYTDHGLRRDCAVVVTPKKALECVMYELNPMIAEAKDTTFAGRSTFQDMYEVNTDITDRISTNALKELGVNMVWLQPMHPIGAEGRQVDPLTDSAYDPGSPYAVRNYFEVNGVLGDPYGRDQAMAEFTNFVQAMDASGIGVMLDGTFNHSAWDCEIGQPGVDMFDWADNEESYIRDINPEWYSKENNYDQLATHYGSMSEKDIAPAPDRCDFGKWYDAAEFHFGTYDCLVQKGPSDTNWSWGSQWHSRFLFENDYMEPLSNTTKQLWQYFSYYPIYWLEKTGNPDGTSKRDSFKGIDGLRCDFAQGVPSLFWEYCINKTRSHKWDFLFMAESLDGYSTVAGDTHHGVGYRSARHFDILNENMVYYWRNDFFALYQGGQNNRGVPNRTTTPTKTAFDARKTAFMNIPILLNLTSHDEILPSYDQQSLLYAYATVNAMAGVPMIMYGQEGGAQNDINMYQYDGEIDAKNNFDIYEVNFGKGIPNFKRYNCMTSIWAQGETYMPNLRITYGRVGKARQNSPALQNQNEYFLSKTEGGYDENIFAVAKYEVPGLSAASQDVVFAFVNNDCGSHPVAEATFAINAEIGGKNWFGIESDHSYNVANLAAADPTALLWNTPKSGADLLQNGLYVKLNGTNWTSNQTDQIQFLKLIDTAATYPTNSHGQFAGSVHNDWDWDKDGMENQWEADHGLDPRSGAGVNGDLGDPDEDGMNNYNELLAGTNPMEPNDVLQIDTIDLSDGTPNIIWSSKPGVNYLIQYRTSLSDTSEEWKTSGPLRTAMESETTATDTSVDSGSNRYYRIRVKP